MFHYHKSFTWNAILLQQMSFKDFKDHAQKFHLPTAKAAEAAAGSQLLVLAIPEPTAGEKTKQMHIIKHFSRSASKQQFKASILF